MTIILKIFDLSDTRKFGSSIEIWEDSTCAIFIDIQELPILDWEDRRGLRNTGRRANRDGGIIPDGTVEKVGRLDAARAWMHCNLLDGR